MEERYLNGLSIHRLARADERLRKDKSDIVEWLPANGAVMQEDGFYHWEDKIYDVDEIYAIYTHRLGLDTPINPLALSTDDTLDYIEGFLEGIRQLSDYIHLYALKEKDISAEMKKFRNLIDIYVMDVEELHDTVVAEILNKMEEQAGQPEGNPCDYPDYDGHFSCPFDSNGSDDCRRHCGLGVDE